MEEVKVSNDSGSDSDSSSGSGVKVELRVKYNTDNKRKEYARGALDHFVFLYGYVRRDKHGEVRLNTYRRLCSNILLDY